MHRWNTVICLCTLSAKLYYWSYSLKLRFFRVQFCFKQSHITKHTSVSSPRKTIITTTLSTKCLSYCNISKPSHIRVCQCGDQFLVSISIFVVIIIVQHKKNSAFLHIGFSQLTLFESTSVLLWGSGNFSKGIFFLYSYLPMFSLVDRSWESKKSRALEKSCRHIKLLTWILW